MVLAIGGVMILHVGASKFVVVGFYDKDFVRHFFLPSTQYYWFILFKFTEFLFANLDDFVSKVVNNKTQKLGVMYIHNNTNTGNTTFANTHLYR